MRVAKILTDPHKPESLVEHLKAIQRAVDGGVEFGSPQDPNDPTSTTRANGTTHNGTVVNLRGSWFEAVLEATGRTTVTCTHNLDTHVVGTATNPNVSWLVFGVLHDGTAADATTTYTVNVWYQGGTRTADAVDLGFSLATAGTAPTINATHPVVVRLFFTPSER